MKRFILTESQLFTYVENKKAEKTYYEILEKIHDNTKFLNENISTKKANQSIIEYYEKKNLITLNVQQLLLKHGVINENNEIL